MSKQKQSPSRVRARTREINPPIDTGCCVATVATFRFCLTGRRHGSWSDRGGRGQWRAVRPADVAWLEGGRLDPGEGEEPPEPVLASRARVCARATCEEPLTFTGLAVVGIETLSHDAQQGRGVWGHGRDGGCATCCGRPDLLTYRGVERASSAASEPGALSSLGDRSDSSVKGSGRPAAATPGDRQRRGRPEATRGGS